MVLRLSYREKDFPGRISGLAACGNTSTGQTANTQASIEVYTDPETSSAAVPPLIDSEDFKRFEGFRETTLAYFLDKRRTPPSRLWVSCSTQSSWSTGTLASGTRRKLPPQTAQTQCGTWTAAPSAPKSAT